MDHNQIYIIHFIIFLPRWCLGLPPSSSVSCFPSDESQLCANMNYKCWTINEGLLPFCVITNLFSNKKASDQTCENCVQFKVVLNRQIFESHSSLTSADRQVELSKNIYKDQEELLFYAFYPLQKYFQISLQPFYIYTIFNIKQRGVSKMYISTRACVGFDWTTIESSMSMYCI